jgi:outer membrane receptor protein involved in Fe transport
MFMRFRPFAFSSSLIAIACHAAPVLAQAAAPAATAPAEAPPATDIVVTGSRIARSGFDAPTPVTVTTGEDVKLSGQPNVERALLELPQVANTSVGTFSNVLTGAGGGYADLNLRGFGANRNLVLVNGRRYAIINALGITDTNTIPTSLVERTEIVTGGSSAVYGSDAITGVANFILKRNFEGLEAKAQVNLVPHTTTPTFDLNLTGGKNFAEGRGNIAVSFNYLDRKGNLRGDFDWSRYSYILGESCIVAGSGTATQPGTRLTVPSGQTCQQAGGIIGYVANGSGDVPNGRIFGIPAAGGSNAGLNAAYAAAGLGSLTANGFTFDATGAQVKTYDTVTDGFNTTPYNNLQSGLRRYMANGFGHFDFSDAARLYGEFHYSHNEQAVQIAPANYNAPFLINTNNPYLSAPVREILRQLDLAETATSTVTHGATTFSNAPNDGLAQVSFGRRFTELGARAGENTRDVVRFAVGMDGKIGNVGDHVLTDLKYDIYYTYSHAREDLAVRNGVSKSKLQQNMLSVGGAAPVCDPFGQNLSATCLAALRVDALSRNNAALQVAQASLTGNLAPLPAGPAGFSLGVEWRKTTASFIPSAALAQGDVAGYNAALPTSGSVNVRELFGEVRLPLIHDTPLIRDLSLNAGFRGSDYSLSGVGKVWTYFYGADWQVSREISLRVQHQRAIRAPSVGELYAGVSTFSATLNDPCSARSATAQQTASVRALCVATGVPAASVFTQSVQPAPFIYAQSGGNPNLKAEKSDTFTAGLVLRPSFLPRLSFSADYFNIKVDGAISALGGGAQNVFNLCYYVIQDANSEFCRAIPRSSSTGEILDSNPARILNANTGGLRTRGIDFGAVYRIPLDIGSHHSTIDLRSNYTYLLEYTVTPVQALPISNRCEGAFGPTCGDAKPVWRGTTRVTWRMDDLSLSLRHRYIGPVTSDRYLVPLRQGATPPSLSSIAFPHIDAQHYFDLSFNLDVTKQFSLYGGANNVFNRDMPNTSSVGLYDPMGTELFLGVSVRY